MNFSEDAHNGANRFPLTFPLTAGYTLEQQVEIQAAVTHAFDIGAKNAVDFLKVYLATHLGENATAIEISILINTFSEIITDIAQNAD